MEPTFTFEGSVWEWSGDHPSWYFVTVPVDESDEIKELVPKRRGFGSVRVTATIGETEWTTSIFPSTETDSYVLPVKKQVRKAEGLDDGSDCDVSIRISLDE